MNHQRKYFAQDYYIYEHFKKIFDKKVKAFGRRKMEREVQKLKHMYEECNKNPKKCSFKRPGKLLYLFVAIATPDRNFDCEFVDFFIVSLKIQINELG